MGLSGEATGAVPGLAGSPSTRVYQPPFDILTQTTVSRVIINETGFQPTNLYFTTLVMLYTDIIFQEHSFKAVFKVFLAEGRRDGRRKHTTLFKWCFYKSNPGKIHKTP